MLTRRVTDMNTCEDYRQIVTAEPSHTDTTGHLDSCADCQAYQSDILEMDRKINAALDIAVPELTMPELPDLDTENVVALAPKRKLRAPLWMAAAASVVLAVFIGVRSGDEQVPGITPLDSLAQQVLAHVDHEPSALQPTSVPVRDDVLASVVSDDVAHMNHDAGLITYAETCPVNGKPVPHLVVQGKHGPITILLMPDETISENRVLDGNNVHGYLLQVGSGSIAIIGEREEQLDDVKQNVLSSVAWDI